MPWAPIDLWLKNQPSDLTAYFMSDVEIHQQGLNAFFARHDKNPDAPIGVASSFSKTGRLSRIALATSRQILVVRITPPPPPDPWGDDLLSEAGSPKRGLTLFEKYLGVTGKYSLIGFNMARFVLGMFSEHDVRVERAVQVPNFIDQEAPFNIVTVVHAALAGRFLDRVLPVNQEMLFNEYDDLDENGTKLAFRAWVAMDLVRFTRTSPRRLLDDIMHPKYMINLGSHPHPPEFLRFLATLSQDSDRLDTLLPWDTVHNVTDLRPSMNGILTVKATRYQERFKDKGTNAKVAVFEASNPNGRSAFRAEITKASGGREGKFVAAKVPAHVSLTDVKSIVTIGRDEATHNETLRADLVLKSLFNQDTVLSQNPIIRAIWFPSPLVASGWDTDGDDLAESPELRIRVANATATTLPPVYAGLNDSQKKAVEAAFGHSATSQGRDPGPHITIVQGPPGCGKTTLIAAIVERVLANKTYTTDGVLERKINGLWLVAESNAAVKNIAEKLISRRFRKWKGIVSGEYFREWHEHRYSGRAKKQFLQPVRVAGCVQDGEFDDIGVILCTISMISNPAIELLLKKVPIKMLVVDEASQVELGSYVVPFLENPEIERLCFVGDDKQLAPFGQDTMEDIKSIFEVEHIRSKGLFLDTQYRMPTKIGDFISKEVYDWKLLSSHRDDSLERCRFVSVNGRFQDEKNMEEVNAFVGIAKWLSHRNFQFKAITPYNKQRSEMENALKDQGLRWEDICFTVDSFQGNEEDYIIVSLVRTLGEGRGNPLGFLKNARRSNVMLSRCKKGMLVLAQRSFLESPEAAETLVGKMASEWENWTEWNDLIGGEDWLDDWVV